MENKRTKGFQRFLLHCSGANIELIDKCPRSEHIKYIGIGATILITAVLAFFSGSYALFTIFEAKIVAILFGIVWAFMIFNLDRLIVSSMRKTAGWGRQFLTALPRIILAIFIGFVISKPLEIRLLQTKIDKEIMSDSNQKEDELDQKCKDIQADADSKISNLKNEMTDKENNKPPLLMEMESNLEQLNIEKSGIEKQITKKNGPLEKKRTSLKNEVDNLENRAKQYERDFSSEIRTKNSEINSLTNKIRSNRKPLVDIQSEIQDMESKKDEEFAFYNQEVKDLKIKNNKKIEDLEKQATLDIEQCKQETAKDKITYNRNSLIDYIIALEYATDDNKIVSWVSLFIITLFVLIETVPVLVKLITPKGPYDNMLQLVENLYEFKTQREINERNAILDKEIRIQSEVSEAEISQELVNNQKILKNISEAHTELINEQIGIWLKEEKGKLNGIGQDLKEKSD